MTLNHSIPVDVAADILAKEHTPETLEAMLRESEARMEVGTPSFRDWRIVNCAVRIKKGTNDAPCILLGEQTPLLIFMG
jgi:hypothetical protein